AVEPQFTDTGRIELASVGELSWKSKRSFVGPATTQSGRVHFRNLRRGTVWTHSNRFMFDDCKHEFAPRAGSGESAIREIFRNCQSHRQRRHGELSGSGAFGSTP